MIRAGAIRFAYGRAEVLRGIDLTAADGLVTGLIGPNGSGKTTLLGVLHGMLRPTQGTVEVDGEPIAGLPTREVARRMAVVVQEAPGDLPLTVAEMVLLGRTPYLSELQRPGRDDHRIAAAALRRVGALHLAHRPFTTLSGGERQRALIARALTQQAGHVLLDEPTNHLDIRYQHEVLELVTGLGATTVVVLHDLNLAARYCDHVVLLDQGEVAAAGTPHDVLVPEVLEEVYGIGIRRTRFDDQVQLLFRPLHRLAPDGGGRLASGVARPLR